MPENAGGYDQMERAVHRRAPTVASTHKGCTGLTLLFSVLTFAAVAISAQSIGAFAESQGVAAITATVPGIIVVLAAAMALLIASRAFLKSLASERSTDIYSARSLGADASSGGWKALSWCGALLIVTAFAWFLATNNAAVSRTFFDLALIRSSFLTVLSAFRINLTIFLVSGVLMLVCALLIAVIRTLPGEAARPLRLLVIAYCDIFRGLPSIITIYLVGFGLPLTNLPFLSDLSTTTYAIIALTLTFSAYTSEIYRAGIDSVHQSQVASARSLGLSHLQAMRYVVVPLAVRKMIPPLLNNFISLQKDTALVAVIGTIDAFNQSKIIASNNFNLSAVTTVAILFVVLTIPQTRLVDQLIERDRKRM